MPNKPKTVLIHITPNSTISVEKPCVTWGRGYVRCDWCDRRIEPKTLYFVQRQITDFSPSFTAKMCKTCGLEKRGAIVFEPFICKANKG